MPEPDISRLNELHAAVASAQVAEKLSDLIPARGRFCSAAFAAWPAIARRLELLEEFERRVLGVATADLERRGGYAIRRMQEMIESERNKSAAPTEEPPC